MIKSEKKIRELSETLNNANNTAIKEAIDMLREESPFEGAIGLLTEFYDKTDDISIRKAIASFMNDLKEQSVCKEIIAEINKQWKSETISMLVSSCWQSRLDYSEFSLDIAKVFLTSDYITAVECLTVIEESVNELSLKKKREVIQLIENNPFTLSDEKNTLILELISILNR